MSETKPEIDTEGINSNNNFIRKFRREMAVIREHHKDEPKDKQPIVLQFEEEFIPFLRKINEQGHSGGSIHFYSSVLSQVLKAALTIDSIGPLFGDESEWGREKEWLKGLRRNLRNGYVTKDADDKASFNIAISFHDIENDCNFTGSIGYLSSSQVIKQFPFTPKSISIDVKKELYDINKHGDCTKGECDVCDGFVYSVDNPDQLKPVMELYDTPFVVTEGKLVFEDEFIKKVDAKREVNRRKDKEIDDINLAKPKCDADTQCCCGDNK